MVASGTVGGGDSGRASPARERVVDCARAVWEAGEGAREQAVAKAPSFIFVSGGVGLSGASCEEGVEQAKGDCVG